MLDYYTVGFYSENMTDLYVHKDGSSRCGYTPRRPSSYWAPMFVSPMPAFFIMIHPGLPPWPTILWNRYA